MSRAHIPASAHDKRNSSQKYEIRETYQGTPAVFLSPGDLSRQKSTSHAGDNLNEDYDEVSVMKKLAVSGGIEEDEVYMDHTGLNTYDTIVHSLEFFNKGSTIVIVTQSYHLYRALYLAQRMGLNAYGVSADSDIVYRGQLYREFREMAARLKDFWYGITKPELPELAKGIITCKSKKFDVYYA